MDTELYKLFAESITAMRSDPVRWRRIAAKQIADEMDMHLLGVTGVYLFGSTDSESASSSSDIDLIIRVDKHNPVRESMLLAWLNDWDALLCELNYVVTGKMLSNMLDIHIITAADVKQNNCFASKIDSVYDPATPLRLEETKFKE